MLAGASALSILVLGMVLLLVGSDGQTPDDPGRDELTALSAAPTPSTTAAADLELGPLRASDVTCSSELPDFPCHALIDGDPTTAWNVPGGGEGAEIRVVFDGPTRVTTVVFHNLADDEGLTRNARARMIKIHITDSGAVAGEELDSGHGPYRVRVAPDPTESLVIHILSTYPGEHYDGLEPFEELALQEVTFTGIIPVP
ncbi:MAG: discoidin domain-containing protein [Acidimicrobiia bacterium]